MRYIYYIAYTHSDGYGNAEVDMAEKIKSVKELIKIADEIAKMSEIRKVCVNNFILLRKEWGNVINSSNNE
jgi:hypothetical protein